MKIKINVIDLDKTLIPYDSFRVLAIQEIFRGNFTILFISILRLFRLIGLKRFKEIAILNLDKKYENEYFYQFAMKLFKDIDSKVLQIIQKESDDQTVNILLSASPDLYVKFLVEKLNWMGTGSYFSKNRVFNHLHGRHKLVWVEENFDSFEYDYNLAISDSSTDDELMELFRKKIKWILK